MILAYPDPPGSAYGLGWLIGRYREHRLAGHSGGIDGFQAECLLLPDDGIGVIAATNTSSSAMAPVIGYRVLDELLGLSRWTGSGTSSRASARRGPGRSPPTGRPCGPGSARWT